MLKKAIALAAIAVGVKTLSARRNDSATFVKRAAAKGVAELQASALALKTTEHDDTKTFAQQMIDDHTAINSELAQVAAVEGFKVKEDAELLDRGKVQLLEALEPAEFDEAYASYEVVSHEKVIELFSEYAHRGKNSRIREFALQALPRLERHLLMAKDLKAKYAS